MRFLLSLGLIFFLSSVLFASTVVESTVFERGENGYYGFRIPAIVQAQNGIILAFAEARKNSLSDYGDIDLVVKSSYDGGLTWSPLRVISDNGTCEAGNPTPVVDETTGNILLLFNKDGETSWITTSSTGGMSWSTPVDITSQTVSSAWSGIHFGTGHGIQLLRGEHAGRIVIPSNHTLADQNLEPDGREVTLIYSDDGGSTWHIGATLTNSTAGIGPNESNVTELVDGTLYVNARNQGSYSRHRLIGYSEDAGLTFTGEAEFEYDLIDPQVQASTLRYSSVDMGDAQNRLLFCNPNTIDERTHLYVRSSFDESQSWNEGKMIYRGPSAYSDMVKLNNNNIGVLYEWGDSNNYEEIRFATFTEEWLDDPTILQLNFDEQSSGTAPSTSGYLQDSRGYGLNGTAYNSPTFVDGDPRYDNGAALRFTGDTEEVRIEDTSYSPLDFEAEDSFTLECVFRTTEHSSSMASDSGPLIAKDTGAGLPSFFLRVQNSQLRFSIEDDEADSATLYSDVDVNDGEWHHVAAIRDADAGMLYVYVDYVFAGSIVDGTTGDFANANDLIVGGFNATSGTTSKRFIGDIDFVRVSAGALALADFIQPIETLVGDLDGDGFVGLNDLDIVLSSWNQSVPANDIADPSGDGFVGLDDLDIVLGNWNAGRPSSENNVPEPATSCGMLGLLCLSVCRHRNSR